MKLLNRILLARFELQAALGVTGNAIAAILEVENGWVATGNVIMLAWMAFAARFAYGKSLEELDQAVDARADDKVKVANAQTLAALPQGSAVDRGILEKLLA